MIIKNKNIIKFCLSILFLNIAVFSFAQTKTYKNNIKLNVFKQVYNCVSAEVENFEFDAKFVVLGYEVTQAKKNVDLITVLNKGADYNSKTKELITELNFSDRIFFDNIKVKGPDGLIRNIGTLVYTMI